MTLPVCWCCVLSEFSSPRLASYWDIFDAIYPIGAYCWVGFWGVDGMIELIKTYCSVLLDDWLGEIVLLAIAIFGCAIIFLLSGSIKQTIAAFFIDAMFYLVLKCIEKYF